MWLTKFFKSESALQHFILKNTGKIQYSIIYINNGYGIEYRKLRKVY